jgi:UDP-N-acetyl-D-glucosamine dehydrogenase
MKIGIVGLGYVGLPLAIAFCEAGHEVIGVDTDPRVADALAAGRSHVDDVSDESLAAISERFHPSSRLPGLARADCAVIVTAHPGLDLERVVRESPLVVDFRGVTRGIEASNLVRL